MRRAIYILILLFSTLGARAQQSVEEEFNSRLSGASGKNRTIVARFEQIKEVVGIKNQVSSSGEFYYDNSGRMAMIYDSPMGDKVIMNGEEFTVVVGGKTVGSSASSSPMMAQISYMMQASMSGDIAALGQGWELSIERSEGEYRVVIEPTQRRVKKYISAMIMLFCADTMTLNELRIDEAQGGFTSYKFTSKDINKSIDNRVFTP